jgi:hypothetical protein
MIFIDRQLLLCLFFLTYSLFSVYYRQILPSTRSSSVIESSSPVAIAVLLDFLIILK